MSKDTMQTILIVDDVPENIFILSEELKDEYKVKAALNGKDALKIVHSNDPPDIVLLDVMMPIMDGYETCKTIKNDVRSRNIPIIFLTALTEEGNEKYGFSLGAVDYISKPFNPTLVKIRIKTHLALHNQNLALEQKVHERTQELYDTRLEVVRRLGIASEYKDSETGAHIIRMSTYCTILAQGLKMSESAVDIIHNASPMHDVGKIGIPDNVLLKPGKLNADEWEVMKTHTTIGGKIIGDHNFELFAVAKKIALTHHERWDGNGYPLGLSGEEIPIEGRISAIADVFDALVSKRVYKSAWSIADAHDYMLDQRGHHFDPHIIDIFHTEFDRFLEIAHRYQE